MLDLHLHFHPAGVQEEVEEQTEEEVEEQIEEEVEKQIEEEVEEQVEEQNSHSCHHQLGSIKYSDNFDILKCVELAFLQNIM